MQSEDVASDADARNDGSTLEGPTIGESIDDTLNGAENAAEGSAVQESAIATEIGAPAGLDGPLITGPTPIIVGGVVTFFGSLALIFYLMMRGRARRNRRENADRQFFEPAGDDAEINFDSEPTPLKPDRITGERETRTDPREADIAVIRDDDAPSGAERNAPNDKQQFSRLFAKADETPASDAAATQDEDDNTRRLEDTARRQRKADAFSKERARLERDRIEAEQRAADNAARERASWEAEQAAARREQHEQERRLAERAAAMDAQTRSIEQASTDIERASLHAEEKISTRIDGAVDRLTQLIDQRMPTADAIATSLSTLGLAQTVHGGGADRDDIFQLLHGVEDALAVQSEGLKAETRNMVSELAGRLQKQISDIEHALASPQANALFGQADDEARAEQQKTARQVDGFSQRLAAHENRIATMLETFSTRLAALEGGAATASDVSALNHEIRALREALAGGAPAMNAPRVQLADLMREALPASSYDLNVTLSNNRRADCLVRLPAPLQPIAIDARFPLEAFHGLRRDDAAASEFKRLALRHVVTVAEHLIHPRETGDAALMLIASETLYTDFLARFPDIMQDAARANVWIVSPTSLAATLNTLRALALQPTPEPPATGRTRADAPIKPGAASTPSSRDNETETRAPASEQAEAPSDAFAASAHLSNGVSTRPPLQTTRGLAFESDQRFQTGERTTGLDATRDPRPAHSLSYSQDHQSDNDFIGGSPSSADMFSNRTNNDNAPDRAHHGDLMRDDDQDTDQPSEPKPGERRPSDFLR
ncbi:MAG: DNA recombination protein RmuC [Pseudomonadota bacterium]